MKHTLIVLAALQAVSAHALVMKAPVPAINGVHRLPGVNVPVVTIKPTMLPNVKLPLIAPNQTLKLANPSPAPTLILPGLFNPNSPVSFPNASNDQSGSKLVVKLAALFDGAGKAEVPAVPVGDAKAQEAPAGEKAELPVLRAGKADNHVTLPENDLLTEIGL